MEQASEVSPDASGMPSGLNRMAVTCICVQGLPLLVRRREVRLRVSGPCRCMSSWESLEDGSRQCQRRGLREHLGFTGQLSGQHGHKREYNLSETILLAVSASLLHTRVA